MRLSCEAGAGVKRRVPVFRPPVAVQPPSETRSGSKLRFRLPIPKAVTAAVTTTGGRVSRRTFEQLGELAPAVISAVQPARKAVKVLIERPRTVDPHQLADEDSLFAKVNGSLIHYKQKNHRGSGEPVPFILMHGLSASVFSWRCIMDDLSELGPVVAFDRPPFGLSERPIPSRGSPINPYDTDYQADCAVALMDSLGFEKAVVVGHSAGGTLAIRLAARHADRLAGLALVAPAVFPARTPSSQKWTQAAVRSLLSAALSQPTLGTLMIRYQFDGLSSGDPARIYEVGERNFYDLKNMTEEVVAGYMRPFQAKHWDRGLQALYTSQWREAFSMVESDLPNIGVPTLVIQGDSDKIVPPERAEFVAASVPGAELRVVRECGHLPHEERAPETLDHLFDFVRRRVLAA
eukprot:tig00020904_g15238.t1